MATEQPVPTKRSRRWMVGVGAAVLLGVLFWALDGWLLIRLNVIGSDAFNTSPQYPAIVPADHDELSAYAPKRIAKFLSFPSMRIKATACLSLADRPAETDPAAWAGVIPKLLALADDPDEILCDCAERPLWHLPVVPSEDGDGIFSFAERSDLADPRRRVLITSLLGALVASNPDRQPSFAAYWARFGTANVDVRRTAFNELASHAPAAAETVAAFRNLMNAGDPDGIARRWIGTMIRSTPTMFDEVMNGSSMQRMAVLDLAISEAIPRASGAYSPRRTPVPLQPSPADILDESRLKLVQAFAATFAAPDAPLELTKKACELFRSRPDGLALLFDAAQKTRGPARAFAIGVVSRRLYEQPDESLTAYLPALVSWLRDEDAAVRSAVLSLFQSPSEAAKRAAADPTVIAACRWMLDEHPDLLAFPCFRIIVESSPIVSGEDVDRIARAVLAEFEVIERRYAIDKKQVVSGAGIEFGVWLDRHPEHRARRTVKQFIEKRAELLGKRILF